MAGLIAWKNRTWQKVQPANNITRPWKASVSPEIIEMVPPLVDNLLNKCHERILLLQKCPVNKNRMATVISSRAEDLNYLKMSLPILVQQMREANMQGEIYIVINCGGSFGVEIQKSLEKKIGECPVICGKTIRPRKGGANVGMPSRVLIDESELLHSDGIKLVFINQQDLPVNNGKIRALRDIYGYLGDLTLRCNYRPEYLYAMDTETILYPRRDTGRIVLNSKLGLAGLLQFTNAGSRIVGAKMNLLPFKDGYPDWDANVPMLARLVNEIHGLEAPPCFNLVLQNRTKRKFIPLDSVPFAYLCGGAFAGDYTAIVGMMGEISKIFTSVRVEDILMTIVARLLGIETKVDVHTVHTNQCPYETEMDLKRLNMNAIYDDLKGLRNNSDSLLTNIEVLLSRWFMGNEGLKKVFGDLIYLAIEDNRKLQYFFFKYCDIINKLGPADEVNQVLFRLDKLVYTYTEKHPDRPINGISNW